MKKIFSFILFCIIGINVFGYSGVMSGAVNLKIAKTRWFDIIYPEECKKSAALLYENADRIFNEVTDQYGIKPDFSMPVVITPSVDTVNAFFTGYPYNRIVLYDTSAQVADELSTVFSETFLSVFRHELTHAVTFNIKNSFWSCITDVFGDGFMPGDFFVTSGMAEGAAVASESAFGEGRLNNEYSKHFVKQAKIENKFPNYFDVQGAADSLIPGIQYYFNGAFHQWLQNKYGMEKYAEFWYRVTNLSRIGVQWSFKKVYGISVRKAWKEFALEYKVPDIAINPVNGKDIFDFFDNNLKNDFSNFNKGGSRYFSMASSSKGIIYSDLYSKKIFFISKENIYNKANDKNLKPEVLFSQNGLESVTVSKDGRFVTASYFSNNEQNITAKIKIYDMESKSFFNVNDTGIKNGVVVSYGSDYYLVCHKYNSPFNSILVKKLFISCENKITGAEDFIIIQQPLNIFSSNFIDLGNGYFCYIKKDGLDFSICISRILSNESCHDNDSGVEFISEFKMPEGVILHDISENNGNIYFSWAAEGTMPRFGFVSLKNNDVFLSSEDVSGGVFNPVVIENDNDAKIIYIGEFFKENRILCFYSDSGIIKNGKYIENNAEKENVCKSHDVNKNLNSDIFDISLVSDDYNSLKYLKHGLLIPLSIYSSEILGDNPGSFGSNLPFGITYANSSPWSNGNDDLFLFTGGWGVLTNSFGFGISINKGTGTGLMSYKVELKTEFDRKGWKQSYGAVNLSSGFDFGKYSYFAIEDKFSIMGGKYIKLDTGCNSLFEKYKTVDNFYNLRLMNVMYMGYSNVHRTGAGRFEKVGITVKAGAAYMYDSYLGNNVILTSDLIFNIPKIIPVISKDDFVYNFPLKLSISLFPVSSMYGLTGASLKTAGYGILDTNIETVLFAMDIQRAVPFFDILFIQDFYFTFGYASTIASYKGSKSGFQIPYLFEYFKNLGNGLSLYLDTIYLNMVVDISANIGVLANSGIKTGMFGQLCYILNDVNSYGGKWKFNFGIDSKF